ncbi:S1 family peptidase [Kitasatospora aureofaciens]|uniref:S1 family peptidase n=1 Tax=Kitasatospora aureofaciens TaxID=1894 RepID=UPI0021092DB2|nr:S1 family peptidase [Kitasatospora aureofaciens]
MLSFTATSWRCKCTAGLAAEDSSGGDYLITADHCFATGSGTHIYGEGDAVGNWQLNYGSYVGDIGNDQPQWDAQVIWTKAYNGAGTNSDEADQPQGQWYPVTSASCSYNGDSVCQDGARSYYNGYGVPCGITVTNQDVLYNITWDDGTVHTVRGVQGQSSGWMGEPGDSGALVFSISGSNTRQARGIASAMGGGSFFWTEAPDILNAWNLHLNPHV